jgi:hypothetical protein
LTIVFVDVVVDDVDDDDIRARSSGGMTID